MLDRLTRITYRKGEFALLTGVCERTVDRWIKAGKLKTITVDRAVLIPATEVDRLLASAKAA